MHKINALKFIRSPLKFFAQCFQHYAIVLIDHLALDSSHADY